MGTGDTAGLLMGLETRLPKDGEPKATHLSLGNSGMRDAGWETQWSPYFFFFFPTDGFQAALDENHLQPALGQAGIFPSPAPRDGHELPTPL